ncbi:MULTISPECIES: roadblock/LC7 domain-containing protein [Actinoplanes]|uniref:roadblock/LC7 domain-containing protein n=1 Tax=Actinoplanes TaxID=1865 RepID=UPI0006976F85|nr:MULTISPECIES: roadblock/LC7 domain-containing protein [Actinoplanes]GLY04449.1 hypothetical protein Acsp01_48280 [Actinoplanes sp. NBRC 101535]
MQNASTDPFQAVRFEMASLRQQVPGVLGTVLGGVDGLLVLDDVLEGVRPHDIAALAAGAHGISRTCGNALGQGQFSEVTIRNLGGSLAVYAVGELALLAVIGDGTLNVARLHIEARPVIGRIAALLQIRSVQDANPRF